MLVIVVGVLAVAVGVAGVIALRTSESSLEPLPPAPVGGSETPDDPPVPRIPAVPCQLPGDVWLYGLCGNADDWLTSVAISGAGTVIAAGWSDSVDGSFAGLQDQDTNGFMAIFEPGGLLWLQRDSIFVHDVKAAPDGTVVAVGQKEIDGYDATVAKYDELGNAIWQVHFTPAGLIYPSFRGAAISQDGTITAWGTADDPAGQPHQFHVIMAQYTGDGVLMWSHDYGEAHIGIGVPEGATVDADGNIFLVGRATQSNTKEGEFGDAMVSKFSPGGELLWSRTFGGSYEEQFNAATTAPNGHIIAVGSSRSPDGVFATTGDGMGVLAEIDQDGNLVSVWTHSTKYLIDFKDIAPNPDGGYVIAGLTGRHNGDALVLVVRDLASVNDSDFLVWKKTFGGNGQDGFGNIAVDSNGGIVVAGTTTSVDGSLPPSHGGMDAVVIRLSPDGDIMPL